ncbi:Lipopolysaccharide biosynthesis protein, LPS:glycosyltransferase [Chitinophaga sp. YR573]|uniref:glycosyltransferase family 8 protein n=1 Tax=Chitinophaga sp. YR573 TaxID=1881040 RepID=UPI0008C511BC|nr:glycosyltransferase [Chitinophaga sp. YR573]SEW43917.1 Lipopolysaccharide biosynthesis protein, LPS:glycosyltransferase [Chitinophaga sp. YR573]
MNIVFVIDILGLEGLGAALTSLIRNCSDTKKLTLHFFCSNVDIRDKDNILTLLEMENYCGATSFYDFNAIEMFGHLNSLHGNWAIYGRFIIPKLIDSEYALYLDADLLILLDVLTISEIKFTDQFLAAVPGGTFMSALDRKFLIDRLGLDKEQKSFNSGVLIFNIKNWNSKSISHEIDQMCDQYPLELISHDQTILNALCNGNFHYIDDRFNNLWYPNRALPIKHSYHNSILHFAGAPKPWDLFGKRTHSGYKLWSDYNTTFWQEKYGMLTVSKLRRTWKIKKSLVKRIIKGRQ